jgi:hypothetical protein
MRVGFVLVAPEGVERSWSAKHCCGAALKRNLDDVGFLKARLGLADVIVLLLELFLIASALAKLLSQPWDRSESSANSRLINDFTYPPPPWLYGIFRPSKKLFLETWQT